MKILPLWAVASTVQAKFDIPDFEFPEQVDVTDLDIESADYIRQYGKIIHDNDPRVARQGFFSVDLKTQRLGISYRIFTSCVRL